MTGRRIAGVVGIVVGVLGGVWDLLVFWARHPRRGGPVVLAFFAVILVLGVVLLLVRGRSQPSSST